jgi:hypothetical protein
MIATRPVSVRALPFVAGTASERARVIIIAIARPRSMLAPVVITIAIAGGTATVTAARIGAPLVVA